MAVALTGVSASLAEGEADAAERLAAQIGIRHVVIQTGEFDRGIRPQRLRSVLSLQV